MDGCGHGCTDDADIDGRGDSSELGRRRVTRVRHFRASVQYAQDGHLRLREPWKRDERTEGTPGMC